MSENQHIEYKESWRDEYLKVLCGFANADGGELYIGINDNGETIGINDADGLLQNLPNKIAHKLGIYANIRQLGSIEKRALGISVSRYDTPISFNGKYYIRSGSTTQELNDRELTRFLLKKSGNTWESQTEERANIDDIDFNTLERFRKLAVNRIPMIQEELPVQVLDKLGLLDEKGKLKRAAVLLFGKNPRKFYVSAFLKVGKFLSDTDLVSTDDIEGNLFLQLEKVFELLKTKYLLSPVRYDGLYRIETLEYPEDALREAIINALIHKDYLGVHIQMKIYPDKIILWNEGNLPDGLTVEMLKSVHPSRPRNDLIANTFFKAGLIETWGRGTIRIAENFAAAGLPAPEFREAYGGFEIIFRKVILKETNLNVSGLNLRQIKALEFIKKHGQITNSDYQKINSVSRRTALREIDNMLKTNILAKSGNGKNTKYTF